VLPRALTLMTDVFGNYVIQKVVNVNWMFCNQSSLDLFLILLPFLTEELDEIKLSRFKDFWSELVMRGICWSEYVVWCSFLSMAHPNRGLIWQISWWDMFWYSASRCMAAELFKRYGWNGYVSSQTVWSSELSSENVQLSQMLFGLGIVGFKAYDLFCLTFVFWFCKVAFGDCAGFCGMLGSGIGSCRCWSADTVGVWAGWTCYAVCAWPEWKPCDSKVYWMHSSWQNTIYHICLLQSSCSALHTSIWLPSHPGVWPFVQIQNFVVLHSTLSALILPAQQQLVGH
jgi:hypothetical protein